MGSFLLQEVRNVLRLEGYEVDKYTNRRVICNLLELKKDSSMSNICNELEMNYIKREGDFETDNDSKKIYLHFLDKETTLGFSSLGEASIKLGINLFSFSEEEKETKILEKIILIHGEKAVLSFNNTIDRNLDFSPCLENKTNINLALSKKLGYVMDYDISLPEIFSILGEKIPNHKLKERLCSILVIPYYFESEGGRREMKKIRATADDEILIFNSLNSAGKFFQTDHKTILKAIEKNYRFPLWFKRYTLEFA